MLTYLDIEATGPQIEHTLAELRDALGPGARVLPASEVDPAATDKRWVRINVEINDADEFRTVTALREAIGRSLIDGNLIAGPAFLCAV